MVRLNPGQLRPGMVLAADFHDAAGEVVLAAGSVLVPADLARLAGAADVAIAEAPALPTDRAGLQAQHEVAEAFRFVGVEHPALRELYRLCVERRAGSLREHAR